MLVLSILLVRADVIVIFKLLLCMPLNGLRLKPLNVMTNRQWLNFSRLIYLVVHESLVV